MSFLAPLMLLGVLGIAVPIAIHLMGRRRARIVRFAAVDFLLGSDQKIARRLRLREYLLLLIRALACLALALVIAKPYTQCQSTGPLVERGPQAAVLIVDDSLASRAVNGDGDTVLEQGAAKALAVLDGLGPDAEVTVLFTTQQQDGTAELSRDHLALKDTIVNARSTYRRGDIPMVIRRAATLLSASEHDSRTIYLISASAAASFRGEITELPPGIMLRTIDLLGDRERDNAAITDVQIEADPSGGPRAMRVVAEVTNFSAKRIDERELRLAIDGSVVAVATVSVEADSRTKKRFSAALPPDQRIARIEVTLTADRLRADDSRYALAELRSEIPVLVVNGDPSAVRIESETFYLETALRPGDRRESGTRVTSITADALEEIDLAPFDVIILANVTALEAGLAARVESWVEGGGGLWISLGDQTSAEDYNKTMTGLLPQRLQSVLDLSQGRSNRDYAALHLSKLDRDHPIFSVFSKEARGLLDASFKTIMLLGPTTETEDRRVLARYTSGAAALVETRRKLGRLLLLTSSVDRDWNDLAIHPGFLPLVQQATRYLARKPFQRPDKALLIGKTVPIAVVADDEHLEIRTPDGDRTVIEGEELEDRDVVRFSRTDAPGIYRVRAAGKDGDYREREEATFAININPQASDLRRHSVDESDEEGKSPERSAGEGARMRRVELWHALALALLLLLLSESIFGLRHRHRRIRG